ncbi:hypothetical protein [Sphingosinicella sp. CPCC 101087]|uniref:hypothetical protein n=1 Tax=Sphingosinicella sp. CPCC 101087 TaxID=2497754 RepID=UPI00101BB8BA|nr:hypothetical protein [Sphingosinicella sp. CPCC 101087]
MRITFVAALAAGLLVGACGGGGQTEATEVEEALGNEFQPAAPSPGGNAVNGATSAPEGENIL